MNILFFVCVMNILIQKSLFSLLILSSGQTPSSEIIHQML